MASPSFIQPMLLHYSSSLTIFGYTPPMQVKQIFASFVIFLQLHLLHPIHQTLTRIMYRTIPQSVLIDLTKRYAFIPYRNRVHQIGDNVVMLPARRKTAKVIQTVDQCTTTLDSITCHTRMVNLSWVFNYSQCCLLCLGHPLVMVRPYCLVLALYNKTHHYLIVSVVVPTLACPNGMPLAIRQSRTPLRVHLPEYRTARRLRTGNTSLETPVCDFGRHV